MRRAATTIRSRAVCRICWIIIRCARLVAAGADCVKILLYYTPFDPADDQRNQACLGRAHRRGMCALRTCRFFLEFVGYEEGGDEKGIEFARKKPEIVAQEHGGIFEAAVRRGRAEGGSAGEHGVREGRARVQGRIGLHARGGQGAFPPGRGRGQEAVHLSFGGREQRSFHETLELAAEAGTNFSGVLCGRATWKDGMPIYAKQGMKALEDWLSNQGVKNIKNVNDRLAAAKPWFGFYGATSAAALSD